MTKHLMDKRDELAIQWSHGWNPTIEDHLKGTMGFNFCAGFDAALEALSKQGVEGAKSWWINNPTEEFSGYMAYKSRDLCPGSNPTPLLEAAPCIALIEALKAKIELLESEKR